MATVWTLAPGDKIKRTVLHAQFGGIQQGGISPSRESPNIFLFSDPASGLKHGYVDHWDGSVFHYTGEGQRGDQELVSGNRAVFDHVAGGRTLRLFSGARDIVEYVGECSLDTADPMYTTDAPETGGGPIREVIVFRLRPHAGAKVGILPSAVIDLKTGIEEVEISPANTEKVWVDPDRQPYQAELREAALVEAFRTWLKGRGHRAVRLRIVPAGEAKPIYNDVWVPTLNLLVEAKGTCTREAIRMAIGQLFDYGRAKSDAMRAVLLPSRPRSDLENLIAAAGMNLVWQDGSKFVFRDPVRPKDQAQSIAPA